MFVLWKLFFQFLSKDQKWIPVAIGLYRGRYHSLQQTIHVVEDELTFVEYEHEIVTQLSEVSVFTSDEYLSIPLCFRFPEGTKWTWNLTLYRLRLESHPSVLPSSTTLNTNLSTFS